MNITRERTATLRCATDKLAAVGSAATFVRWTAGPMQSLLPHGMMVCGTVVKGGLRTRTVAQRNFPVYLEHFSWPGGNLLSPVVHAFLESGRPQRFEPGMDMGHTTEQLAAFKAFDLRNVISHGVIDRTAGPGSHFSFLQIPGPLREEHERLLETLVPHMHSAMLRITVGASTSSSARETACSSGQPSLTERERQILDLIGAGKSNREIAMIGACSEHTVKTQVHQILSKTGLRNRTQAATWWANRRERFT